MCTGESQRREGGGEGTQAADWRGSLGRVEGLGASAGGAGVRLASSRVVSTRHLPGGLGGWGEGTRDSVSVWVSGGTLLWAFAPGFSSLCVSETSLQGEKGLKVSFCHVNRFVPASLKNLWQSLERSSVQP